MSNALSSAPLDAADYIKSHIRTVPDWPQPGVQFRDITPLLQEPKSLRVLIDLVMDQGEHGMELVPVLNARRGDLVMFRRPRSWSLGIVALNGFEAIALDASGFVMKPPAEACSAWRI